MVEIPDTEQVHASAVTYLIDKDREEEARILLACYLGIDAHYVWVAPDEGHYDGAFEVELAAPRVIYDILKDLKNPITEAIVGAIAFTLDRSSIFLVTRLLLPEVSPNWRENLLEATQEPKIVNQGNPIKNNPTHVWNSLRFRSASEIKIAQALDKTGVLFFPNCMARLGIASERKNREADFLICEERKWGILEVDGEAYHSTAAKDHDRDRLFRSYGVRVIERFTADQCYNNPDTVVRQFLTILKKNA